jgi:hypothetical protein
MENEKRASVDRTDQIPDGASFKRRSGKFAANLSVLDYLSMPASQPFQMLAILLERSLTGWRLVIPADHQAEPLCSLIPVLQILWPLRL